MRRKYRNLKLRDSTWSESTRKTLIMKVIDRYEREELLRKLIISVKVHKFPSSFYFSLPFFSLHCRVSTVEYEKKMSPVGCKLLHGRSDKLIVINLLKVLLLQMEDLLAIRAMIIGFGVRRAVEAFALNWKRNSWCGATETAVNRFLLSS